GIPIPQAQGLLDTSRLRVLDAASNLVPAEFQVLARWGGGPQDATLPIEWLLVDFPATVAANATAVYQLDDNSTGSAPAGIQVSQTAGAIDITTGLARFEISRTSFDLFHAVWLDLNHDGTFTTDEQIVRPNAGNGAFALQGQTTFRGDATA